MDSGQERLRAWIDRAKLTQRAAAKLLGIHYTFLNQLLSTNYRRRSPALGTAIRIERLTGIPVEAWMPTEVDDDSDSKPRKTRNQHVGR
jgi:transcriptional regulator with XRE-family HTH domain